MPSFFFKSNQSSDATLFPYTTLFRSAHWLSRFSPGRPANASGVNFRTLSVGCMRSEEHTSEIQPLRHLLCRLFFLKVISHLMLPSFPTRRSSDLLTGCLVSRPGALQTPQGSTSGLYRLAACTDLLKAVLRKASPDRKRVV